MIIQTNKITKKSIQLKNNQNSRPNVSPTLEVYSKFTLKPSNFFLI